MSKITKETTLSKILENPKAKEILEKYNVPCLGCPMAKYEIEKLKIGEVCKSYGVDSEALLDEMNKIYNN